MTPDFSNAANFTLIEYGTPRTPVSLRSRVSAFFSHSLRFMLKGD